MSTRPATPQDESAITTLIRAAFPEEERESIVQLAHALNDPEEMRNLALIAEDGGALRGYIAFSPLRLSGDERWRGCILAPLAVAPGHQRQGVGSHLIEAGLASLREVNVAWALVYGDPAYYGRFGFDASAAGHLHAPYPLTYPSGWQALQLADDASTASGN